MQIVRAMQKRLQARPHMQLAQHSFPIPNIYSSSQNPFELRIILSPKATASLQSYSLGVKLFRILDWLTAGDFLCLSVLSVR